MFVSSGWGCSVLMYAVIKPKYQSSISEDTLRKIEKSCAETADMAFRPVYCPFCRAHIVDVFEDIVGHFALKCQKCKGVVPINTAYFRRMKRLNEGRKASLDNHTNQYQTL